MELEEKGEENKMIRKDMEQFDHNDNLKNILKQITTYAGFIHNEIEFTSMLIDDIKNQFTTKPVYKDLIGQAGIYMFANKENGKIAYIGIGGQSNSDDLKTRLNAQTSNAVANNKTLHIKIYRNNNLTEDDEKNKKSKGEETFSYKHVCNTFNIYVFYFLRKQFNNETYFKYLLLAIESILIYQHKPEYNSSTEIEIQVKPTDSNKNIKLYFFENNIQTFKEFLQNSEINSEITINNQNFSINEEILNLKTKNNDYSFNKQYILNEIETQFPNEEE